MVAELLSMHTWSWQRLRTVFVVSATVILICTGPTTAQSIYGCTNLLSSQTPAYEGRQGVFFRLDPDLLTYNRVSDGIVTEIAKVARALTERGTTLVYVPVPAKSLAMPQYLGPDVAKYGYDPMLAARMYADTLQRLDASGVRTVDASQALRTAIGSELVFFKTDPRLTNVGLFALAREIAKELGDPLSTGGAFTMDFETKPTETITLPSRDRFMLQLNCQSPLPDATTLGYATRRIETQSSPASTSTGSSPVVVVGTDLTGNSKLNFAGFLSELSGYTVAQHGVGSDGLASMSNYLTSDDFQNSPPRFLVWTVPVWSNLGLRGDQPFRELVAAARGDCSESLDVEQVGDYRLRVDLSGIEQGPDQSLMLYNSVASNRADFRFHSANGRTRMRPVVREGSQQTGRFYMPLTGLWNDGSAYVEIETEFDPDNPPTIAVCRG